MKNNKNQLRLRRKKRVRVKGTAKKPRLVVYRSLRVIYAALVDDQTGRTLVAVDSRKIKNKHYNQKTAQAVGELLAQEAKKQKIDRVVFDRNGYRYHGKVKALADGAREGGLKF